MTTQSDSINVMVLVYINNKAPDTHLIQIDVDLTSIDPQIPTHSPSTICYALITLIHTASMSILNITYNTF